MRLILVGDLGFLIFSFFLGASGSTYITIGTAGVTISITGSGSGSDSDSDLGSSTASTTISFGHLSYFVSIGYLSIFGNRSGTALVYFLGLTFIFFIISGSHSLFSLIYVSSCMVVTSSSRV